MLVHFPIVLWSIAVAAYIASAAGVGETAEIVAKFANAAGLLMAVLAMIAGAIDIRTIDSRDEAMQVAIWHMMSMATAWVCLLLALLLSIASGIAPSTARLAAAGSGLVGFLVMAVGGWLGGRLVYTFGVGVKVPPNKAV